ncbi:uncharacterized protein IL334_003039 [Kwoniella shivajii]|uniref:Uncharacterized protein n=1 Tax=Kwoniella shivajii TaxID=564305 RepID=A0ABZ1CWE7_9TREE|nr:hypothetical protein IL334_003039 [Kwoniella shivajii]
MDEANITFVPGTFASTYMSPGTTRHGRGVLNKMTGEIMVSIPDNDELKSLFNKVDEEIEIGVTNASETFKKYRYDYPYSTQLAKQLVKECADQVDRARGKKSRGRIRTVPTDTSPVPFSGASNFFQNPGREARANLSNPARYSEIQSQGSSSHSHPTTILHNSQIQFPNVRTDNPSVPFSEVSNFHQIPDEEASAFQTQYNRIQEQGPSAQTQPTMMTIETIQPLGTYRETYTYCNNHARAWLEMRAEDMARFDKGSLETFSQGGKVGSAKLETILGETSAVFEDISQRDAGRAQDLALEVVSRALEMRDHWDKLQNEQSATSQLGFIVPRASANYTTETQNPSECEPGGNYWVIDDQFHPSRPR